MAKPKTKRSKNANRGIFMTILFLVVVAAVIAALFAQPEKPPQVDATNPKEEAIESYVWKVYGLDILPKEAICAETTMQNPVLNCVYTTMEDGEPEDLRFWCSIEHDTCVEHYEQLAGIIEEKEKEMAGPDAKARRRSAIANSMGN